MKHLIVGCNGQVGQALMKMIKNNKEKVLGIDLFYTGKIKRVDVMHICFPMVTQRRFELEVERYVKDWKPKLVIIHSTVLPMTTRRIFVELKRRYKIVHSPVRGQHNDLYNDMKRYVKYIGPVNEKSGEVARRVLNNIGFSVRVWNNSTETELVKILDTCTLGVLSAWALEGHRICKKWGVKHDLVREFAKETQKFYGLRPDVYPPLKGFGGHCIFENVQLLKTIEKSPFLDLILKVGKCAE